MSLLSVVAQIRTFLQPTKLNGSAVVVGHPSPSVAWLIGQYLEHMEGRVARRKCSVDHLDNVRRSLVRFAAVFGHQAIDDCRPHDLTRWIQANPQWEADWTVIREIRSVRACFNWGESEGLTTHGPYRRYKLGDFRGRRRDEATKDSWCKFFKRMVRKAIARKKAGDPRFQGIGDMEKITAYCLRHSFVTEAVESGASDQQLADHCGWTSSAMLKVYKHTSGRVEYLQGVAAAIGSRRRRKPVKPAAAGPADRQLHFFPD